MWQITVTLRNDDETAAPLKYSPAYTSILFENESFALAEHDFFRLLVAIRGVLALWGVEMTTGEARAMTAKCDSAEGEGPK